MNIQNKPGNIGQYFFGTFMHTPVPGELEILEDALLAVDTDGTIASIHTSDCADYTEQLDIAQQHPSYTSGSQHTFFIPGLVDLHIHAPQWPQLGKALHLPLEDWLQNCTFPLEAKYADVQFARVIYDSLVKSLLANGTTSAVYFATVHEAATNLLADICLAEGQRAWVGRVAMDNHSQCPDYYRDESTAQGLADSESSIAYVRAMPGNSHALVKPIITPRFIPSCTDEMLSGLGDLAQQYQCHIQTHCSESDWEHQYVIDRLGVTDTAALSDFGLLTRHTVLAHSNFIDHSDMTLIHASGAGIAHCPLSNQYFAGAVFPLRAALNKGVRVGLGTDISGGPSASQFDSCRHVVGTSRMLESGVDADIEASERGVPDTRVDFLEAFYLATVGGAKVLDERVGQFQVGYKFDVLQIDASAPDSNLLYFPDVDTLQDLFQKTLYAATRSNIAQVWVSGQCVAAH